MYALYKASIKQNVLIRLVSSIRYVRVQDLGKMKCTAVRKRDERQRNEYKREGKLRRKAGQIDGTAGTHTKNSNSPAGEESVKVRR